MLNQRSGLFQRVCHFTHFCALAVPETLELDQLIAYAEMLYTEINIVLCSVYGLNFTAGLNTLLQRDLDHMTLGSLEFIKVIFRVPA